MSTPNGKAPREKGVAARLPGGGQRRAGGGPPWMSMGQPTEKSMNFGPSAKRLLRRLAPFRAALAGVISLAVARVALSVVGTKILGKATDIIFAGVIGKQLPRNATLDQIVAGLRAKGDNRFA